LRKRETPSKDGKGTEARAIQSLPKEIPM